MKRHQARKHGMTVDSEGKEIKIQDFPCRYCDKKLTSAMSLKKHEGKHESKFPFIIVCVFRHETTDGLEIKQQSGLSILLQILNLE